MMASLTKMLSLRIVQFQELKVSHRRTGLLGADQEAFLPVINLIRIMLIVMVMVIAMTMPSYLLPISVVSPSLPPTFFYERVCNAHFQ